METTDPRKTRYLEFVFRYTNLGLTKAYLTMYYMSS